MTLAGHSVASLWTKSKNFEHRESRSLGLNGAVFPLVCGALCNAEELCKFTACHTKTASKFSYGFGVERFGEFILSALCSKVVVNGIVQIVHKVV